MGLVKKIILPVVIIALLGMTLTSCSPKVGRAGGRVKGPNDKMANNKAEYLFIKGMDKFIKNEFNTAMQLFEEALELSPNNAAIYYKLGECYFLTNRPAQAIEYLEKSVEYGPKNKTFYTLLAEMYYNQGQYGKATQTFKDLLANTDDAQEYWLQLGDLNNELGANEMAKYRIYNNSGVEDEKRSQQLIDNANEYFLEAIKAYDGYEGYFGLTEEVVRTKQRLYIQRNDIEGALKEGEKLVVEYPLDVNRRIAQSDLLFRNGLTDRAIEYMEKTIEDFPTNPRPRLVLADYYRTLNEKEKSEEQLNIVFDNPEMGVDSKVKLIADYISRPGDERLDLAYRLAQRVVKSHPTAPQGWSVLGDTEYLKGDKREARESYEKAVELDSEKPMIWRQIIMLDSDLRDHENMLLHTQKALEKFPEDSELWYYNGFANMMLENNDAAVISFQKGRDISASDHSLAAQFDANLGDAYHNAKQYAKSDSAYERALVYNPNNAHVLNNYSYYLSLRKDNLEYARSMCERLIRMHPKDATYLDTYAWVLYQLEDYQLAKKYLERALETTSDGTILEHYGDVLFRLNKTEDALEYWLKAKENGGVSDLIDKKISDKKLYEE